MLSTFMVQVSAIPFCPTTEAMRTVASALSPKPFTSLPNRPGRQSVEPGRVRRAPERVSLSWLTND